MANDEPTLPSPQAPPRRARRTRWIGALLVAAALLVLLPVINELPTERPIRLQVSDPASLLRLDLNWLDGDERIHSMSLRFADRPPSAQLTTHLRVTDGDYRLQLRIERTDGVTETERRVRFAPDVSLVVIPIP